MFEDIPVQAEDGALVGTEQILTSPNVCDAPPRVNGPVQVPSVYSDDRGEIHNIQIGERRINILYTKAGVLRSGDLHKDYQHDFIFSGKVGLCLLQPDGSTLKRVFKENDYITIPPYTPHILYFVRESVIAEWWDGPFHAWFYKPYRSVVEQVLEEKSKSKGRFAHYVLTPLKQRGILDFITSTNLWAGIFTGLTLGYVVSRRR